METSNYRGRSLRRAALAWPNSQPFIDLDEAHPLAQAIVDTIRDPLLVLDRNLRVVTANRAFHQTFRMNRQDIQGRPIYGLGDGQWDIPELRLLLEDVAPQHAVMEAYEVERDFPIVGRRLMLLNAREVFNQRNSRNLILLTFEDVTDRRAAECEITKLLQQKETLLQEMQHRVANSLQIIASILLLKARAVQSEETRLHLRDAYQRVMSVAAVQQQLLAASHGEPIEIGPYLSRLCEALAASMTDDSRPISLKVQAEGGTASSAEAVSIGLIVTELVINAFKHAFVDDRAASLIVVAYEATETSWRLAVSDNGIGTSEGHLKLDKPPSGLGTIIVEALAKQLDARVEVVRNPKGTTASITHGTLDRAWPSLTGSGGRWPPKSNGGSVAAV
ncbi:MAG TPA: histidine kinase dimerization/phosphoacceptor domain -containing protein [Xanthobacteraceae bacterium]|nr:histidine kinase dimerization/phosphoacceptor domain -containing protein [Xanthobacteraceae bacterium]